MTIGSWARRVDLGPPLRPVTLWHLIESEVSDRLVMRCGREMHHKRDLPFEFSPAVPAGRCWYCDRREPQ